MNKKPFIWLTIFIAIFIFIRSINFIYHLNWSGDQASFAIEALKIYRTKTLTLIGPQISANLQGRFVFQGPAIYYMLLFFLILGRFDPVITSYLFMLFCSLMIIPLFYGVKKLINEKAAWVMVIIYSLIPYYINYTRFIWNSTFLMSLLPILIFLMAQYKQTSKKIFLFATSCWLGLLLQFHYQFILVIVAIFIYYFFIKKIKFSNVFIFIFGLMIGFSPLIIFELKHSFYNLNTMILYLKNWNQVDRPGGITMPHYYISISFMLILMICGIFAKKIKKIPDLYLFIGSVILFIYALTLYLPKPTHAFWAPSSPWNYTTEKKIYEIIKSTKLKEDFNVANFAYYDTPAVVIKYFLKKDSYQIDYGDYYHNNYLFVITEGDKYLNNPAYEIGVFKPYKIINKWKINEKFDMLLLKKDQQS